MAVPAARQILALTFDAPPAACSPNSTKRGHERWQAIKAYRHACKMDALSVKNATPGKYPLRPPIAMTVTFVLPSLAQRRDMDNLIASFKPGQDGIVDARIIPDDSVQVIARVDYRVAKGPRAQVAVTVEEVVP